MIIKFHSYAAEDRRENCTRFPDLLNATLTDLATYARFEGLDISFKDGTVEGLQHTVDGIALRTDGAFTVIFTIDEWQRVNRAQESQVLVDRMVYDFRAAINQVRLPQSVITHALAEFNHIVRYLNQELDDHRSD